MKHTPAMVDEVLRYVLGPESRLVLDVTVGCGGHARAVLDRNPTVRVIGIDRDAEAIDVARDILRPYQGRCRLVVGNFADLGSILSAEDRVDGVLADLGVSSLQIDTPSRGFSYTHDGPLSMEMDGEGRSARSLIEDTEPKELARILKRYGEVGRARLIAHAVNAAAQAGRMETTGDLKAAVEAAVGGYAPPVLLSQVFQAIRIVVNDELSALRQFLSDLDIYMAPNGRLCVISYHSLEDRIIKEFLRTESRDCICPPKVPVCVCRHRATLEVLTPRVIRPSVREVELNPRVRSARLRAARFF